MKNPVGQNKLNEAYVIGQLHADLFELSELPDMALSNRQGYKSDDKRYEAVINFVRNSLLADILKKRELYSDLKNAKKKEESLAAQKAQEEALIKEIEKFRTKASKNAADTIIKFGTNAPRDIIEKAISDSINSNSPDLGLKSVVDSNKKRILISQTQLDKPLADIIYKLLVYNNVPEDHILYTNCDDEVCRVPEGYAVYDYLRQFFVESYSTQKIYVLFVTSENSKLSWGAITEVGAAWITQIDHKIFNISPFRPEHPLDDQTQWHNTNIDGPPHHYLWMSNLNADIFCQKLEHLCDCIGYVKKQRADNKNYLGSLVQIR